MYKLILAVLLCVAVIEARTLTKRQALAYALSAGAEEVLGPIKTTFECGDKIYGYYADIDNDCKIFHVCYPQTFPDGNVENFIYSFFCGNQTVFDQEVQVCVHPDTALPCQDSALFYMMNENFGQQVWHTTPRPVPGYSNGNRRRRDDEESLESE